MKKAKTVIILVIVALLVLGTFGCSSSKTVATVNGENITADDFVSQINQMLSYYGTTYDELEDYYVEYYADTDAGIQAANAYKDSFLDELVIQTIMFQKAKELGLDQLSEEENQQITEEAQKTLQSYKDYYRSMAEDAAADDSSVNVEEYTEELYQDFLSDTALTEEKFIQISKENAILEKVYNYYLEQCEKTEEDYKAYYDSQVEQQKAVDEEDPDLAYYNYTSGGNTVNVYVPSLAAENNKICKDIYIGIDEDTRNKILELNYQSDPEKSAEKIAAETKELRTPALKKIRPKADEAYNKAKDGVDFDQLVKEYSDGYVKGGENTYDVYEYGSYDEDFLKAAMALKNVGDISGIVVTDYGFHIIQYAAIPEVGPIPYEKVADVIKASADEEIEGAYWKDMLDKWLEEADVTRISFINGEGNDISEAGTDAEVNPVMIVVICVLAGVIIALIIVLVLKKKKKSADTGNPEENNGQKNADNDSPAEDIPETPENETAPETGNDSEEKDEKTEQ